MTRAGDRTSRIKYRPSILQSFDLRDLLASVAKDDQITVLPQETVEGHECNVLKIVSPTPGVLPGVPSQWVVHARRDCSLIIVLLGMDSNGRHIVKRQLSQVDIDAAVQADQLQLTNPVTTQPVAPAVGFMEVANALEWVCTVSDEHREAILDLLGETVGALQDQDQPASAAELWRAIAVLDPGIPHPWAYLSWHAAYIRSEAEQDAGARWACILDGIDLLHDGLLEAGPQTELYHQLAWTYFHRIGEGSGEKETMNRRFLATAMEVLLGPTPAASSPADRPRHFEPVARAPFTLAQLVDGRPGVRDLVDRLRQSGIDVAADPKMPGRFHPLEHELFLPYARYQMERTLAGFRKRPAPADPKAAAVGALLDSSEVAERDALLAFLRAKVLREQYRMDPEFMQQVSTMLGANTPVSLDWRTPWAHTLYWAFYGTQKGSDKAEGFALLNRERLVLFSLGALLHSGDFLFVADLDQPERSTLVTRPDWAYVPTFQEFGLRLARTYAASPDPDGLAAGKMFQDYHLNLCRSVLLGLYLSGREHEASRCFEYIAENLARLDPEAAQREGYKLPFRKAIGQTLAHAAPTPEMRITLLSKCLYDAYICLARGQDEEYRNRAAIAFSLLPGELGSDITNQVREQIEADALGALTTSADLPLGLRASAWQRAEANVKRRIHGRVIELLTSSSAADDWDFGRVFSAP